MAALKAGGQWTIAAVAANLSTILGITDPTEKQFKSITVKNADGAANKLYVGNSNVTNVPANAHVELGAGQSMTFYSGEGWLMSTDEIYLVGTANAANIAFINCTA